MGKEGENDMTEYEKTVALWQEKSITNDAELAEALHAQCISFAYNSGKMRYVTYDGDINCDNLDIRQHSINQH